MNLLLDTHVLIWTLFDDPQLSDKARDLIANPLNTVFYSAVSIWKVAIKHALRPNEIPFTAEDLAQCCQEAGFHPLGIQEQHVFSLETLSRPDTAPPHRDPFDRMLLSQAKSENMHFLTHDRLISYYNEPCTIIV